MQDGNIHCHVDNLSRRKEDGGIRIAVATAAYVSGGRVWSDVEQRFVGFEMREDVPFSAILLPTGAPGWAGERAALWNRVDLGATRRDARLAKTIVAAVARDIPATLRVDLLRAFVAPLVALGCVADIAIHEDGTDHNPHVHIMLTTRHLGGDGFAGKIVALEQRQFVKQVRARWAELTNRFLEKAGSTLRVDHRSYKARGIEAVPTVHRGPDERERRDKREHARRVREQRQEDSSMAKPDHHEQRAYPLLAARETWPPEPVAPPDLTPQERDEHHRYWEDRKLDRLEAAHLREPESIAAPVVEPTDTRPWYEQARDRARSEAGISLEPGREGWNALERSRLRERGLEREDEPVGARLGLHSPFEESLHARAMAMGRTRAEAELLDAVRFEPPETRRMVQDYIVHKRMEAIREQDLVGQLQSRLPRIREQIEALPLEYPGGDRDLPVPGPKRELLHPRELERAQDDMVEAHRRDAPERDMVEAEVEREVAPIAWREAQDRMVEDYEREEPERDLGERERER